MARTTATATATTTAATGASKGETDDPAIRATRLAVLRAMLVTVFASAGTPMLLAGDEMLRTQGGNNNAY